MSQLHQIALTFVKNIGHTLGKIMVSHLGSAEAVFNARPYQLLNIPGIGEKTIREFNFDEALKKAAAELKFIEKNNIEVLFYTDARYPKRLKNCFDAPILLYSKGNTGLNARKIVSIVGTRNATGYGRQLCEELIAELQQYDDVLVVSGLAHGIDVIAHKECIKNNVTTIGVFGHGLDRIYPVANKSTADKMLENGGWLTEYPSGTIPGRENFPERNRIVAGMADATIVIEASVKGGALITAEIANSYNRDVFAFPGRVGDVYSEGCNFLIRNNKAALLTCAADLAYSLGWEKPDDVKPAEQFLLPLDLSPDERTIFDVIQQHNAPLAIDDLTLKTNMPMSQLAMNLLNMEMQGFIRSLPGKMYRVS
ncbi:DNA-processing protein DprA [Mucilaginibacter sp. UR6-11]|uniref:DNA-processing protein DprA n=1 Tax=Mucilaginibacter sp. UR6-11 TaxID=1435644 RepID=UPI001E58BA40|nr:DNA-processing protein DprA [Mucilaginibacter sp. UR6-11]MCC8426698.1 DNA-processing protein DprA [Mucilaginibacter sp. UR6-11]